MALVNDLLDRFRQLENDRQPWLSFWMKIARYVLPDAERFDAMFAVSTGPTGTVQGATALASVVNEPIGQKRGQEIYDTTSLWAVDRGAAGTLALVTPEGEMWHSLKRKGPFTPKSITDDEKRFYDDLRDYLFEIRTPTSGWGIAQKAAYRCVWAFGTSVLYIDESNYGIETPISYRFVPLSENYLGCNFQGVVDTNFRLFTRSARQCVQQWGTSVSAKTQAMAADPVKKDQLVTLLHAVYPRDEKGSYGNTNRDSGFSSCIVEVGEKLLISESGYFEFPYRIDNWQRNNGASPYSEGPIALALAEIKSLNMLSKQELLGVQQWVNPPIITNADNGGERLNLNPRAINPGYMDNQGRALAAPLLTTQRPDFAAKVLEARRGKVAEVSYLNLWQTILDSPREQTAYEVMQKAKEKGDMLGPVGTSLQVGLEMQVDREIKIIGRRGAFRQGEVLAPPESLAGQEVGARFAGPLDRMREMSKLQGMTQLVSIGAQLEQVVPGTMLKIDADAFMDEAQRILGAPREVMRSDDDLAAMRQTAKQQADAQQGIAMAHGAGQAAASVGTGAQALADSPAAADILRQVSGLQQAA